VDVLPSHLSGNLTPNVRQVPSKGEGDRFRVRPELDVPNKHTMYRGAYTKLVDFLNECRQTGCKPLSDECYYELFAAVESLGPQGGSNRRRSIEGFVNAQFAMDAVANSVLVNFGITGFDDDEPYERFKKSTSFSSGKGMTDDGSLISHGVQSRTESYRGRTFSEATAISTITNLNGGDDDDEYEEYSFPKEDSVRFRPRATRFMGKKTLMLDTTQILSQVDFNARMYTSDHGLRDVDQGMDMQLMNHIFVRPFDLLDHHELDEDRFATWVNSIADQYLANSYHNWAHALEVTQFCYLTLTMGAGSQYFNQQDILALLCACVAHDVAHPGLNSAYLVRTSHEMALRYNDKAPIENMHAHRFFETLRQPGHNFLHGHTGYKSFRRKVIDAILATDMAEHFAFVDRFATRVAKLQHEPLTNSTGNDRNKKEASKVERRMLIEAFIHTADFGPNCRNFRLHIDTVKNLEEEWFLQGDLERRKGIPISPNFDRSKDSAASIQKFFCEKMVGGVLAPFSAFINPQLALAFRENLDTNVKGWADAIKLYGKKSAAELAREIRGAETRERLEKDKDKNSGSSVVKLTPDPYPRGASSGASSS